MADSHAISAAKTDRGIGVGIPTCRPGTCNRPAHPALARARGNSWGSTRPVLVASWGLRDLITPLIVGLACCICIALHLSTLVRVLLAVRQDEHLSQEAGRGAAQQLQDRLIAQDFEAPVLLKALQRKMKQYIMMEARVCSDRGLMTPKGPQPSTNQAWI